MIDKRKVMIYQIYNRRNRKSYIGASKNAVGRWSHHINTLNKGIHANKGLQKDWIDYGYKSFDFRILELNVEKELSDVRESYWIDCWQGYCGYNILPPQHLIKEERIKEVIKLLRKGKTFREINGIVHISLGTIHNIKDRYL